MKKLFALGIIILFLGLAIAPTINSQILKTKREISEVIKDDKSCEVREIVVREYHGNGAFTEVQKEVPTEVLMKIKETKDFEEKLQLLKKYNLVSSDASVSKYKKEAQNIAKKMGITQEKINRLMKKINSLKSSDYCPFLFNVLSQVELVVGSSIIIPTPIPLFIPIGMLLPAGLSLITSLIALISFFIKPEHIPTADLAVMGLGLGMLYADGLFGKQVVGGIFTGLMIGFAGVITFFIMPFNPPMLPYSEWGLDGFSILAAGVGSFGFHS